MKTYFRKIGIADASPRTLRHTMAVHYLAKGAKKQTVQEMLGVKEERSMEMYEELSNQLQGKMVQELAL